MMGPSASPLVMSEEEKMLTAYHEAGHAIVGLNVVAGIPVHKATIIPAGAPWHGEICPRAILLDEVQGVHLTARGGHGPAAWRRRSPSARTISLRASSDIQQATKMAKAG